MPSRSKLKVDELRRIEAQLQQARDRAEREETWGGPEAKNLEAALANVQAMASEKSMYVEALQIPALPTMPVETLRQASSSPPRVRFTASASVCEGPPCVEASAARRR